jgi:signal transduction histidine kinase/ligand-binding sensor domain-containing protein/AmiR/NasT family two-component response regulator
MPVERTAALLGSAKASLILLFLVSAAFAQRQSFKYYGQEQGLSNLATECLLQDRAGYLWVGTQNGLFRYDGAVFTAFGEADGLPSAPIDALVETPDGVLWVATSRGLARRRGSRFESVHFGRRVESSGRFGLAADSAGRLYLSTIDGLLVSTPPLEDRERRFELVRGQPAGPAYGVHADGRGEVWFGCGSQVCRLSGKTITVFGVGQAVPPDRWDAITTDREGVVWIRSSTRLLRKIRSGEKFEHLAEAIPHRGDFATLSVGRDGSLFVPTDEGVWELSNGRWRGIRQEQGLIASSISAVLQDREGSIWVGFWGAGLARWVGRNQWESWTRADGLSGDHIWQMTRDRQGSLWVATGNGVNQLRMDPRSGREVWRAWTEQAGLAGNKTRAIALAPDGSLWTGSSPGGISRIDPVSGKVRKYSLPRGFGDDRVWQLSFDRTGTLWVSTRGGLFFCNPGNHETSFEKQILPMGDPAETVSATIEDRQGRLWAAGTRGLARRENHVWKRFTTKDGLPSNAAGFLAEAPDGSIWLGYRDRTGLSRIVAQGDRLSVQTYNLKSGLRSDQAIFVWVDRRGWVWFGTDNGVDVLRGGTWRHYGQQDGLIWDDCNTNAFYEDEDGSVWIGTSRGLAHFRAPASEAALDGPRVEFTRIQLGDDVPDTKGGVAEPYRNRMLTARLAVLTFLAEDSVLCRYRLAGLDEGWLETKQREVRFSHLPAGKFVLEAVARNPGGEWSRVPARIAFQILPPWWGTWWFRSAVLLSGALVAFLLVRWRTRRLVAARVRLEGAVEERTRQLRIEQQRIERQNTEIERLLDRARQASAFKDEFLANMSHEIRTPINGIFGMINLMLDTELKPEQNEALETVRSCTQSLLGVLNDILDVSKIEAGKLEIVAAPFRTADTVQSACSTFVGSARDKGIQLTWEVAEDVPEWLACDAARIRQVLLNLVGNALKFTHRGAIRVLATVRASNDGTVELHFAVSDTGIGISQEARGFIFEAFRQADGSTSRTYGGTGLGLTISSRLVRLMGGEITVESEPGRGSVFAFFVKTRQVIAPPECAAEACEHSPQAAAARCLRVLLAEDNIVNQRVATALLSRRGHKVVVVGNGRLAVERTDTEAFDVILMDLQMPDMDGWSATQIIRERDGRRGVYVPIIALTAHAMSEAHQRCLTAGMDSVIVKPFNPAQLYGAIEHVSLKPREHVSNQDLAVESLSGEVDRCPGA